MGGLQDKPASGLDHFSENKFFRLRIFLPLISVPKQCLSCYVYQVKMSMRQYCIKFHVPFIVSVFHGHG